MINDLKNEKKERKMIQTIENKKVEIERHLQWNKKSKYLNK